MSVHDSVLGIGRNVIVPKADYTCRISGDRFSTNGYTTVISENLTYASKATYEQMLAMVPEGYRIGLLEPIAELRRLEEAAKADGKSVREALKDTLFERFVRGNPYRWERTGAFLRAVNGTDKLGAYVDNDSDGRKYVRADFGYGDKIVAEGVRFPKSLDGVVVEINPVLLIPAIVAKEGQRVPEHTMHAWLNPDFREVGVVLYGYKYLDEYYWYDDVGDRCLYFYAVYPRYLSHMCAAFRLVHGSLDDVPLPVVKKAA